MTLTELALWKTCQFNWDIRSGKYDPVLFDITDLLDDRIKEMEDNKPAAHRVRIILEAAGARIDHMLGLQLNNPT